MSFFDKFRKAPPEKELAPVTYEETFQAALALQKKGHKEAARDLFKRVAAGVPQDRTSCHALGVSYFGEDYNEAANWFGQVLKRSEENDELRVHSLTLLAQCFLKVGDKKQAIMCLQGLHALRPEFAQKLAEELGLLHG